MDVSKEAEKFLVGNKIPIEEVKVRISKAIRYFQGEGINIDIKKLRGGWKGFYRIRSGRMRIIAEFNFDDSVVFVERVDWRGNIYK